MSQRVDVHVHLEGLTEGLELLTRILGNQESLMIDTTKVLASVRTATTKINSLLALDAGRTKAMREISQQLADLIAAGGGDPTQLRQVQADLDQVVTELDATSVKVQAEIEANTPPDVPPPPIPPST